MYFLLLLTNILFAVHAIHVPLNPRADDGADADVQNTESIQDDGPTGDGSAGLGVEFESPGFGLIMGCNKGEDTSNLKGKLIEGHAGNNWKLTADTGEDPNKLNMELIFDGVNIKVGTGDAAAAGEAAVNHLVSWNPKVRDTVNVETSDSNPWFINGLSKIQGISGAPWSPQVTTPMPFEAIYSLMKDQKQENSANIFVGANFNFPAQNYYYIITEAHFESQPNGIDKSAITNDVLGFCSLVMTYAKAATTLQPGQSPKLFTMLMPRADFNTLFEQVSAKLPGDLFDIFDILACYTKESDKELVIDQTFCKGETNKPVSLGVFAQLTYSNKGKDMNVEAWIRGMGAGNPSPDLLTTFDRNIDGSIGGLSATPGKGLEKMYNSDRLVPLFEMRNLDDIVLRGMKQFMSDADELIQQLHAKFASKP